MEIKKWLAKKLIGFDYESEISRLEKSIDSLKYQARIVDTKIDEKNLLLAQQATEAEQKERRITNYEAVIREQSEEIERLKQHPIRNFLGSIDLSQIRDPMSEMDEAERKQYVQSVFGFHKLMIENVEFLVREHIEWWARNSMGQLFTDEAQQNAFARGNLNFADLIIQRINELTQEHIENVEESKENQKDKNKPNTPLSSDAPMDVLNLVNGSQL